MATRITLAGFLLAIGLLFGINFDLAKPVSAQGPTMPLQDAVSGGHVEVMNIPPFAVSNRDIRSMNLSFRQILTAVKTNSSVANWPLRSEGCSTPYLSSSNYKSLPIVPGFSGDYDFGPNRSSATSGNYRNWSGSCRYYDYSHNSEVGKYVFDAGTSSIPVWSIVSGFSINPLAYGGWATAMTESGSGWVNSAETSYSTKEGRAWRCLNLDDTVASGKLTDYDTTYMHPSATPIWPRNCKGGEDGSNAIGIYRDNGVTIPRVAFRKVTDNQLDRFSSVRNAGVSLFRSVVNITQEQLDQIKAAEARNGGLGLDIVADDFFTAYINGAPLGGTVVTIEDLRFIRINSDSLRVGNNLLGIEVLDKANVNGSLKSLGVGLIFQVRLYDRLGYKLAPKTTCYNHATGEEITGPIASGTEVRCEHTFPMDPAGGGDTSTIGTFYSVACDITGSATVSSNCDVPRTPGGQTGTVYTKSQLDSFVVPLAPFVVTGSDGDRICTQVEVSPGGRERRYGRYYSLDPKQSTEFCIQIGAGGPGVAESPLAYFLAGDVFATGNIAGNIPYNVGSDTYGTHGDYAIVSNRSISDVGSNSRANNNSLAFGSLPSSPLGNMGRIPSSLKPIISSGQVGNEDIRLNGLTGQYRYTGNRQIVESHNLDSQIALYVTGNLTINGNITVNNSTVLPSAQLPNIIIVAGGDITIDENVTQIDATLVSHGTIRTCQVAKTSLNSTRCNNKLRINGPIAGKKIGLYRTALAGNQFTDASEVVVYNPSALIIPFLNSHSGSLNTEIEYELPPRY